MPRHTHTWDVGLLLKYLKELPENANLVLQVLSHKLAMLMDLANTDRCSELAALDLLYCSIMDVGVKFVIPTLTKSRRSCPPI